MQELFDDFIREKQFLENISDTTVKYYGYIFNRWNDYIKEFPTKKNLKEFVIRVRESGVEIETANSYIRGVNAFLTWLYENEHTEDHLKIKKFRVPEKTLKLFSDEQIKKLLKWRPKTFAEKRLHTMICLAFDTGVRIKEMLTLERENIDLNNLLITICGKGNKERIVPISLECRKILFRFLKLHNSDIVFPTTKGFDISYETTLQQFKRLCKRLKIKGVRASWHTIRHTFASNYIRDGGNVIYLQKILGHSDLQTTKIYVQSQPEDLQIMHKKTSLLKKFR